MKIECLLKREEPIRVPIGSDWYEFAPDERGRRVAEVTREEHIKAFLACSSMYRELPGDDAADDPERQASEALPMKRPAMIAELKKRGIGFAFTAKNAELAALLAARPGE